ncbi:MAG: hypothetical protein H6737_19670 [Alphaproteobacteria bacterium]|nr:hypothetical protein [Alphaproteobacteria bacterium]
MMTITVPPVPQDNRQFDELLDELERLSSQRLDPRESDWHRRVYLRLVADAYEREHFQVSPPTPVEAIEFLMDQRGLTQQDLAPLFGGAPKVSEVLSGRRSLSLRMIRNLVDVYGMDPRVLLGISSPKADVLAAVGTLHHTHVEETEELTSFEITSLEHHGRKNGTQDTTVDISLGSVTA